MWTTPSSFGYSVSVEVNTDERDRSDHYLDELARAVHYQRTDRQRKLPYRGLEKSRDEDVTDAVR